MAKIKNYSGFQSNPYYFSLPQSCEHIGWGADAGVDVSGRNIGVAKEVLDLLDAPAPSEEF